MPIKQSTSRKKKKKTLLILNKVVKIESRNTFILSLVLWGKVKSALFMVTWLSTRNGTDKNETL